jgi:pimeloyl-ACP methyl ester carboxylesterase
MKVLRRVLLWVVVLAVVAYLGAIVYLVASETRLVFAAVTTVGDRRPSQPFEQLDRATGDAGEPPYARAWVLPAGGTAGPAPWVIFLHGNDSNIGSRLNIFHCERLRALGLNVIAPEYRGFGGLGGQPTEAGLAEDARRWYDYLRNEKRVDPRQIVIYGWSLGSGVAVNLASHVDEGAVVLEGAPASLVAIGQQRYPMFPIRLIIRNSFESILKIGAVRAPILFLHSPEDVIIPIGEGRRLFDAARQPKQFVEVTGGHVYASEKDPRFFPTVQSFLRAQHLLP